MHLQLRIPTPELGLGPLILTPGRLGGAVGRIHAGNGAGRGRSAARAARAGQRAAGCGLRRLRGRERRAGLGTLPRAQARRRHHRRGHAAQRRTRPAGPHPAGLRGAGDPVHRPRHAAGRHRRLQEWRRRLRLLAGRGDRGAGGPDRQRGEPHRRQRAPPRPREAPGGREPRHRAHPRAPLRTGAAAHAGAGRRRAGQRARHRGDGAARARLVRRRRAAAGRSAIAAPARQPRHPRGRLPGRHRGLRRGRARLLAEADRRRRARGLPRTPPRAGVHVACRCRP